MTKRNRAKPPVWDQDPQETLALSHKTRMLEDIERRYLDGADLPSICQETGFSRKDVASAIEQFQLKKKAEEVRKDFLAETIADKLPLLQQATGLSLKIWLDKCKEIEQTGVGGLSIAEAKMFLDAASKAYEMSRLEEGKSTSNVKVEKMSIQQVQLIMKELQEVDPVFEYPVNVEEEF